MSKKAEQLVFDLPHREAFGRDDFLVTSSNAAAIELIDQWPNWPSHAAIILGPEGSGKSHLVEVWRQRSGAALTFANRLDTDQVPDLLVTGSAAIEDIYSAHVSERALFHALNLARQESKFLLLTSRFAPTEIKYEIPDLASRIRALPIVQILPPNDALLRGVLVKLFTDRQVMVDEGLISYILLRMPRSLGAAKSLVAAIDQRALIEKSEVTKPFVARILAEMESPELFASPPV